MGIAEDLVNARDALFADAGRHFGKAGQDIAEVPACFDDTAAKLQACSDTEAAETSKCDADHAARLATCNAIQCTSFTNCAGSCNVQCTDFTNCGDIQCTDFTNCNDFWASDPRRYACYLARGACEAEKAIERTGCFALRAVCIAAAAAATAVCTAACEVARAACVAAAAVARAACAAASVVVLGACKALAWGKSVACKAGVIGSEVVCAVGKVADAGVNIVIGIAEGFAGAIVGAFAQAACFVSSLNPKPGPILTPPAARSMDRVQRDFASARGISLATNLCLDPDSPYDEEGIHLEYRLTNGNVEWAVGAGAQPKPLDFDSRDLPPFAGVQPPGPLAVSYDQKRLGQWGPPPQMDIIAASGDRAFAKRLGTDDVFILVTAPPYVHRVGRTCLLLPQSFFKLDPELGQSGAKIADLLAHVSISGDDEMHPSTERFPLFREMFSIGTISLAPLARLFNAPQLNVSFRLFSGLGDLGLLQAMDVRMGARVWHKVDLRPARNSADPPKRFPQYSPVTYATNNPCKPTSEKFSVDFHAILDLGIGVSHYHEQHDNRFGGELDNLSAAAWKILGAFETSLTSDLAYQFANGPIQDYGGWVDGTCIYYMLVQLKPKEAIRPEDPATLKDAYAILWTDEQTAFTERWRLLDLEDSSFTSPFKPMVGVLPDHAGEFYDNLPFSARRFWNPFAAGHVIPSSRMAVTRQIVLVTGRDPETGRHELYSIHFSWPTMDRTWRWRDLPAGADVRFGNTERNTGSRDVVRPDTLRIREDSTILMDGSRTTGDETVFGTWFQRYLPADGQETPSATDRAAEPELSKPSVGYPQKWDFVAAPAVRVMHERFSHFGVYEGVRSRIQCYRVSIIGSERLGDAEIEKSVWQDTRHTLQLKHSRLNWTAAANFLDGTGSAELAVTNPTHPSIYNDPMNFRVVKRPGLAATGGDWLLMHLDKRDDKLRPFDGVGDESALQEVILTAPADSRRSITVAFKSHHRNNVRELHGATVRAEKDEVSPPQIRKARLRPRLGARGHVGQVEIELTIARDLTAPHGYASVDEWLAVNVWRVKMGAIIPGAAGQLRPVLLYDVVREGTFTRNSAKLTAVWYPGSGDQRDGLLADLLTPPGRIVNGTSMWFVGATGLACCADETSFVPLGD